MRWVLLLLLACTVATSTARAQSAPDAAPATEPELTPPPPPPPDPERQGREVLPAPAERRDGVAAGATPPGAGQPPSASEVGPRIAAEVLLGALGEVGGGLLGFYLGAAVGGNSSASIITGLFGLILGATGGTSAGVMIGGLIMGGTGTVASTLLGALGGTLVVVLATPVLAYAGPLGYVALVLPLLGAIIGYENSRADGAPRPARPGVTPGGGPSVVPVVQVLPDGASLFGLAGQF